MRLIILILIFLSVVACDRHVIISEDGEYSFIITSDDVIDGVTCVTYMSHVYYGSKHEAAIAALKQKAPDVVNHRWRLVE